MPSEPRLPTAPRSGPYLQAALLCEKLLTEDDGTVSAVRVFDTFAFQPPPAEVLPPGMSAPPAVLHAYLLVILKSGAAPGNHVLQIVARGPSGHERPFESQEITLFPHAGATHVHELALGLAVPGDYNFDVVVDGEFVSSVPLRVVSLPAPQLT